MSIETSAKAGHNVKALFKKIAMALPGGAEAKDAAANQSKPIPAATTVRRGSSNADTRIRDRRQYARRGTAPSLWLQLLRTFVCFLPYVVI